MDGALQTTAGHCSTTASYAGHEGSAQLPCTSTQCIPGGPHWSTARHCTPLRDTAALLPGMNTCTAEPYSQAPRHHPCPLCPRQLGSARRAHPCRALCAHCSTVHHCKPLHHQSQQCLRALLYPRGQFQAPAEKPAACHALKGHILQVPSQEHFFN